MMRSGIVLGLVVGFVLAAAAGRFTAEQAHVSAAAAGAVPPETELSARVAKLQSHVAALTKTVKVIADNQALFARSFMVEPNGTVRITGNVRVDNNLIEDIQNINCDQSSLSGKRQCTCPEGLVAVGIELRPQATSAYPGPATYNTAILCGRF
jgi:hypothetical protein